MGMKDVVLLFRMKVSRPNLNQPKRRTLRLEIDFPRIKEVTYQVIDQAVFGIRFIREVKSGYVN